MANPKSSGDFPKGTVSGFYTLDGEDVAVVIVKINHDTTKEATAKGNTTVGYFREDLAGTNGKVYTLSGTCYRHDRK